MILFQGADPNKNAINAVRAAIDIQDSSINESLKERDPVMVNMGINSGLASVGSTRFRGIIATHVKSTLCLAFSL